MFRWLAPDIMTVLFLTCTYLRGLCPAGAMVRWGEEEGGGKGMSNA